MSSPKPLAAALGPSLSVLAGLTWAGWYVWSVAGNDRHDDNAMALIGPLFGMLLAVGIVVVAQTLIVATRTGLDETLGLKDRKRLSYLVTRPLLLAILPWLGFLCAGLPFFVCLAWLLGFRRPVLLLLMALGIVLLFGGIFNLGLDINLPLWPAF